MRTAVAADEPDEPERPTVITGTNYAAGAAGTGIYLYSTSTAPPTTTATSPQRVIGPWRCPDCKTWMAPTVAEHRCST